MEDADCTGFLQWVLPRLGLRWAGFRRVRGQVCKRLGRRVAALGLKDLSQYRALLKADTGAWRYLDSLCRISISRFYRDRGVWGYLEKQLLPRLAAQASTRETPLRIWRADRGADRRESRCAKDGMDGSPAWRRSGSRRPYRSRRQ